MGTTDRKSRRKKRLKLTSEQRKAVWAASRENAGAGWHSDAERYTDHDPIRLERSTDDPT